MKTIHIKKSSKLPLDLMREIYDKFLKEDQTFHFVIWGAMKWQGYQFEGYNVLLRVDEEQVKPITAFLEGYQHFDVYDYPFPDRRGHLNRFGLGKKSIESKYPELFHQIYHLYSVMSIKMKNKKERHQALMQLLHIPLNVYHYSMINEALIYTEMTFNKLGVIEEQNNIK